MPAPQPAAPAPAAVPPPPLAQPDPGVPPPPPTGRVPIDEHTGFFFQAALGIGWVSIEDEYTGDFTGTETIEGSGTLVSFRFGGGVGAGFVIGGGFEGLSGTFDYKDEWTDDGGGSNESEVDGSGSTLFAMGQKYFGPFFIRAELGAMWGGAQDEDAEYGGFMLSGGLGADFLISDSWSLGGVAAIRHTSGSYENEDGYDGDYSMTVPSIQFSATYF